MVLDTSAIVAILFDEPERFAFNRLIEEAPVRLLSAVSRVETSIVVESRKGRIGRRQLDRLLSVGSIEVVPVTAPLAELACEAHRRFGRGRHPAALNIGDCFVYALAKATGEPLLCKGEDFTRTDLTIAR